MKLRPGSALVLGGCFASGPFENLIEVRGFGRLMDWGHVQVGFFSDSIDCHPRVGVAPPWIPVGVNLVMRREQTELEEGEK
jgi:hypothetical protein